MQDNSPFQPTPAPASPNPMPEPVQALEPISSPAPTLTTPEPVPSAPEPITPTDPLMPPAGPIAPNAFAPASSPEPAPIAPEPGPIQAPITSTPEPIQAPITSTPEPTPAQSTIGGTIQTPTTEPAPSKPTSIFKNPKFLIIGIASLAAIIITVVVIIIILLNSGSKLVGAWKVSEYKIGDQEYSDMSSLSDYEITFRGDNSGTFKRGTEEATAIYNSEYIAVVDGASSTAFKYSFRNDGKLELTQEDKVVGSTYTMILERK